MRNKDYSVLLLYPDHMNDSGTETYFAHVKAVDAVQAVGLAQFKALRDNDMIDDDPSDFIPLLCIAGHHYGEPLYNE